MLLVSCIPLTGTLMLIHYYLVSAVDTGKLKLSQLKRKSKKHYDFFSPNNRYYATPSEALPWNSLCCLHTCFLCSEKENSISSGVLPYPQTTHPERSYKHSFFCFKGGEKRSGMPVPGCQNTSHPHQLTTTEEMILCVFTHYVRAQLTILWELRM